MHEAKRRLSRSLPVWTDGDEEDGEVVRACFDDESIGSGMLLPVPQSFEIPKKKEAAEAIFLEPSTKRHGGESCRSTTPRTTEAEARASRTTVETGAKVTRMVWVLMRS